jgi:hypothetical protein
MWVPINSLKVTDDTSRIEIQLIAPGIISTNMGEYSPTFDCERNELYFMRRTPGIFDYTIYKSTLMRSSWTEPEIVTFSGKFRDAAPYLSPDGNTLFYDSKRPDPSVAENSINLWFSNRTTTGWSKPTFLKQSSINVRDEPKAGQDEFGPAVDGNGKLYFYSFRSPDRGGSRYSSEPPYNKIKMDNDIPDPSYDTFVSYLYISPDGRLAITEGKGKTGRDTDLYFSRLSDDGQWSPPTPITAVNTAYGEGGPFISSDGKYFFFTSNRPTNDAKSSDANLYMVKTERLSIN